MIFKKTIYITAGVALTGGIGLIGYQIRDRGNQSELILPPPAKPRVAQDRLAPEDAQHIELLLGRDLTAKESREVRLFISTALSLGYDLGQINRAVGKGIQASKYQSVAEGFEIATGIQTWGYAGQPTPTQERDTETWRMCGKRIRQIEQGAI